MSENGTGGIKIDAELEVPRKSETAGYLNKFLLPVWAVPSSWEL
jgi:hypothetical protein